MATPKSRELSITYGAYEAGGGNGTRIDGFHQVTVGVETSEIRFTLFIQASNSSDFGQKCRAAEEAFRKPNGDVIVKQGSTTLLEWRHSRNSGFDAVPQISKPGVLGDTGLTREYQVSVTAGMPADKGVTAPGARRVSMEVVYAPSRRRTVTIEGVFTALGSSSAREMYEAQAASVSNVRLAALTGDFEIVEEEIDVNTFDKVGEFRRVYRELIFGQAGSTPDDSSLVGQSLRLTKRLEHSQSSRDVDELATVDAEYSVSVDATSSTDLEGKYDDVIRDWLIARCAELLGGNQYGVAREAPTYDRDNNAISVSLSVIGSDGGGNLVAVQQTFEDDVNEGTVLVPAWDANVWARHVYQGPASYLRRVSETRTVIGSPSVADSLRVQRDALDAARQLATYFPGGPGPGRWDGVKFRASQKERRLGLSSGQSMTLTDITGSAVMEGYDEPASPGQTVGGPVVTGTPGGFGAQ